MDEMKAGIARHNANRHLALYMREQIGLLVFRAYREYRKAGVPVPESILLKLDEWAVALARARTEHDVAAAIEMDNKGRHSAHERLRDLERNRDLMEHLLLREKELDQRAGVAAAAVAADFNLSMENVKRIKSRWLAKGRSPAKGKRNNLGRDLQDQWLRRTAK